MRNVARFGRLVGSRSIAAAALMVFASCQGGVSSEPPDEPNDNGNNGVRLPVKAGPERPLSFAPHASLAFRQEGASLIGGHRTHAAEVRDGAVTMTPHAFERGQRFSGAPLVLETTSITIDDGLVGGGAGPTRAVGNQVHITRGDVVEVVRNEPEGIFQEWHFAKKPGLDGDLVVEVSAIGQRYTGVTDGGLHFMSDAGVGVRYSHALWIDAVGAEWPIEAKYADGRIAMVVPQSVLAETSFPAVLDPTVSAEIATDTPVNGFTGAVSQNTAIAFDGTNYLVVWEDTRNSADSDIWGTRVSAAGTVLDTLGIEIANGAGRQSNPTVVFDGTKFVVAWQDFKVAAGTEADIDAANVSVTGVVTQLAAVAATGAHEQTPQLAATSTEAMLVWTDGSDVRGAVQASAGSGFGGSFAIAATAAVEIDPTVAASSGSPYLVVWSEGATATADLRGQLVTSGGAASGAAFAVSAAAGAQYNPTATWAAGNYGVVWTNNNAGINLYGTRVSTAGAVLDTRTESAMTVGGIAISTATNNQELSSIACTGSGCVVMWQERRNLATTGFDLYGQLLNTDFTLSGGEFVADNANLNQFAPAVTSTGTSYFTSWHDTRDTNVAAAFGATLSAAAVMGTATPLARGNNQQTGPRLGRDSGSFAVFWSDSRNFGNDIRFVRLNSNGTPLDAASLSASAATAAQISPAATVDLGSTTLAVWSDGRGGANKDIYAARVDLLGGTVSDPSGIAVTTAAGDQLVPDVASSGSVALAVWQDRRSGNFDIYGALINSAGAVTVADILISNVAGDQTRPAVTWDATASQFIVVWSDPRSGGTDIYGSRVSSAGAVLDAAGVLVSGAANGQFRPSITSHAGQSFAAWEDRRTGQDIYATRLTGGASLTVADPGGIAVSTAAGSQTAPKIAALGATSYVVVWEDARGAQPDIYGQEVTTTGLLSGLEFVVANSANPERNPGVMASAAVGSARVVYETTRDDLDTIRVNTRLITTTGGAINGTVCTEPSRCASGFCVDGYCCDTACGGNDNTDCQACRFTKTGQANGTCAFIPSTTICRNYASTFCDLREYCTGTSSVCPPDLGRNQGLVCNAGTGAVCPPNAAPGPHGCP